MFRIKVQSRMKKDLRLIRKRGYDEALFWDVVRILAAGEPLPAAYHDHALIGGAYKDCRECHILPDWLLVYQIRNEELLLILTRTGTHSDLFP